MSTDRSTKGHADQRGLDSSEWVQAHVACALLAVNDHREIVGVNSETEKLLLRPAREILHRSLEVLPASLRAVVEETFLAGSFVQGRHISLPKADPGERPCCVSSFAMLSADGNVLGVVAAIKDLSPAKALEEHLRHLDCLASIGTLSTSMAHEIKNALVAVKTFLDLLIQQNKDADLAQIANRELRRADSIVSQMLRFAGPAKPTFTSLHLHDVLEHSLRVIEPQLAGKQIRLKKSLAASPDLVRGDNYQLEQAVLNLLYNAIEATGPDGELTVTTELVEAGPPSPGLAGAPPETQLCLSIKDNGIGIPPENISRLFDPFFTTKTKGTGLGLSITRRIIQEHHGSIGVESEPNQGTTFTLLLPAV